MVEGRRQVTLPDPTVAALRGFLQSSLALVYLDQVPVGSAFFISDTLLLSCQHVVAAGDNCAVRPFQGELLSANVVLDDAVRDFTVLEVAAAPGGAPRPCVLLGLTATVGDVLVGGYPRQNDAQPGAEIFPTTAHPRDDAAQKGAVQSLKIEAGKVITPGMSGGPILDLATGEVTAIMRWSEDPGAATGGGGVPISQLAAVCDDVRRLAANPPPSVCDWRDALGRERWQSLGHSWDMTARVDLRIGGDRLHWRISLDQGTPDFTVTVQDLGDDVTKALFKWAQRRRIRWQEEVDLVGQLLARALLPPGVADHLRALQGSTSVLVRMFFEEKNDLADIPWELTILPWERSTVPGQNYAFLATHSAYRLVRVMPGQRPGPGFGGGVGAGLGVGVGVGVAPDGGAGPGGVTVLATVALPKQWSYPQVRGKNSVTPYKWPETPKISSDLRSDLKARGFSLDPCESAQWSEVSDALQANRPDVFHFIGVGRRGADGEPLLSFASWNEGDEDAVNARYVLQQAAQSGVKLVVLELVLVPEEENFDPLTASSLGNVFADGLRAVVLTHLPVHPAQLQGFNQTFYREVGAGKQVEAAVQEARNRLQQHKQVEDAAGFGWFTLLTDDRPGLVLVSSPQGDGTQRGLAQSSPLSLTARLPGAGALDRFDQRG